MNSSYENYLSVESVSLIRCLERVCEETRTPYKERRVIEDIMTRPVEVLTLDHSVKSFLSFMLVNRVRHAPVVDYPFGRQAEPEFIGVISQRDVLRIRSANAHGRLSDEPDPVALRQLLSRVVTRGAKSVEPETPIGQAVQWMIDLHIDMLPVVVDQQVLGIVTTTDLLRMIVRTAETIEDACFRETHQKNPSIWAAGQDAGRIQLAEFVTRKVETMMKRDLITLNPEQTLGKAIETLQEHTLRHIPIVDEDSRLVGILSDRDILRHLPYSTRKQVHVSSKFREDLFRVEGCTSVLNQRIDTIMTKKLWMIEPSRPMTEAALMLMKKKIGVLPVTDSDGRIVGIVSVVDLLSIIQSMVG